MSYFLDVVEITAEAPAPTMRELKSRPGETTEDVARRVAAARRIQAERAGGLNTALGPDDLDRHCPLDRDARRLLDLATDRLDLDDAAVTRIRKVGRTIADLDGSAAIRAPHIGEAIQYRSPDSRERTTS